MNFLQQTKLTKEEWDKIEQPIQNNKEKHILKLIQEGYNDINIKHDNYICLTQFLKINKLFDGIIFDELLKKTCIEFNKKNILKIDKIIQYKNTQKISKIDKIKLTNSIRLMNQSNKTNDIIEFIILKELKIFSKYLVKGNYLENKKYSLSLFNLNILYLNYKEKINQILKSILDVIFESHNVQLNYKLILKNISNYIEHNPIFNYKMDELYQHQKDIFTIFNQEKEKSKFIFYCAPTCSGKTLSPLGLSNEYKVIFVCASKHIGLSLAKSAFFLEKKIGFAFGCNDIDYIRLNYNAINSYKEHKYRKIPDHSDGKKVEIMICDILSYESAMLYMTAFHKKENIILFWDEPTIGLDEDNHKLHDIIKKNWTINKIPNVIFSCATLPKQDKIQNIIERFSNKFENVVFKYIDTADQYTNLCIYDKYENIIMPHNYFKDYKKMIDFLNYQNKKYYKFYNCNECTKFLLFYDKFIVKDYLKDKMNKIEDLNLTYIKEIYVSCLKEIVPESWNQIQTLYLNTNPFNTEDSHNIGTEITTKHAKSLTNGPTLYITNNIENICNYFMKLSNIDKTTIQKIEHKIEENSKLSEIISNKQKDYEDKIEKCKDHENIMTNLRLPPDVLELKREIETLQSKIQSLHIENKYKPNTRDHYNKWNKDKLTFEESDVYSGYINDLELKNILQLYDIHAIYKILLLLGIGIFSNNVIYNEDKQNVTIENNKYIENMKELAENKSLYLILANSDYIYGTNYQFSHCYLGKDMINMTQEKIIQCIGRIGRQEKNKHFSFRFRSNEQIDLLYSIPQNDIESENMNKLFI